MSDRTPPKLASVVVCPGCHTRHVESYPLLMPDQSTQWGYCRRCWRTECDRIAAAELHRLIAQREQGAQP